MENVKNNRRSNNQHSGISGSARRQGGLLLVESYVRTEEVLNRETLLDLFKRWKEEE